MSEVVITFRSVGLIHGEHTVARQTPTQPVFASGCRGWVEIYREHEEGLRDLEGFSHICLLYHLHQAGPVRLSVKPFLQDCKRGVFATRAPSRPNSIRLSIVELLQREGNRLIVSGVDILDGTPLLDFKPYTTRFDCVQTSRNGWQDEVAEKTAQHRGRRDYNGGGAK